MPVVHFTSPALIPRFDGEGFFDAEDPSQGWPWLYIKDAETLFPELKDARRILLHATSEPDYPDHPRMVHVERFPVDEDEDERWRFWCGDNRVEPPALFRCFREWLEAAWAAGCRYLWAEVLTPTEHLHPMRSTHEAR